MKLLTTPDNVHIFGSLRHRCHECDTWCDTVVQVGEPPDAESSTANLCLSCAEKAFDLIKWTVSPTPK